MITMIIPYLSYTKLFFKNDMTIAYKYLSGDSKWPFHPLIGGHLTP